MNYRKYADTYKSASVQTANPGKLVLMLYDGALRFMSLAERGFELEDFRERFETVNNNLIKAQNIVTELQNALDLETEGDFAVTMYRLYDYMHSQLQEANIKKEVGPVKTVQKLLTEIRDAWSEMLEKGGAGAAESSESSGSQPITSISQSV